MKILFLGQTAPGQTARMRMEALGQLGHEVVGLDSAAGWRGIHWVARELQQKCGFGPTISQLNTNVLRLAAEFKPDLLWADKQEYLWPETISNLQEQGVQLLHFTPDPYYFLAWKRTRIMDRALPLFDYVVTSKRYELADYQRDCRTVIYMPLGYAESTHRPLVPGSRKVYSAYRSDVGFVGGWEPRRERLLHALAASGEGSIKIWGHGWDHLHDGRWTPRRHRRIRRLAHDERYRLQRDPLLAPALQGEEIYSDEYAWALSSARIGVGFLRFVCPDQHTTRTFEIPACASMMIADRTEEHLSLFAEGQEAEFFETEEELVDKVRFYLHHEAARERIALQGYKRCVRSGYSYENRLSSVMARIEDNTS